MPEKAATRSELYTVHEGCLARPYVQLKVPSTAIRVRSLELSVKSRDQGWGGGSIPSTWHDVLIHRSPKYPGRSHVNPITFYRNPVAVRQFGHHVSCWDCDDPNSLPFYTAWVSSILQGDIIQIVPKAFGMGWTNIVSEASIKINYDEAETGERKGANPPTGGSFRRIFQYISARFETVYLPNFQAREIGKTSLIPEFLALSYCWGEIKEFTELEIATSQSSDESGIMRSLSLSKNVVAAIKRLRTPDKPLVIWIDAVCINQQDTDERSEQVAIMSSIYNSAAEVHIWLGEDTQALKSTLQIIRDTCNIIEPEPGSACAGGDQCFCGKGWEHMIDQEEFLAERAKNKEQEETGRRFRIMDIIFQKHQGHLTKGFYSPDIYDNGLGLSIFMSALFGHPWFWRVWVIQEAILAKNSIVHCGREMEALNRITLDRTSRSDPVAHDTDSPNSILDISLNALDLSASDPRDKLYTLLPFGWDTSINTELPTALRPNYDTPPREVYANFTRRIIRQENALAVLSLVHCNPTRTWNRMLGDTDSGAIEGGPPVAQPTWGVSPQGHTRFIYSNLNRQFAFRAGGSTVPDKRLLDDESDSLTLKVTGYEIGSIIAKGSSPYIKGSAGGGVDTVPFHSDPNFREPENGRHVKTGVGVPLAIFEDSQPLSTVDTTQPGIERVIETMFDPCRENQFQRGLVSIWEGPHKDSPKDWVHKYANHLKSHIAYLKNPKPSRALIREMTSLPEPKFKRAKTPFALPCLSEGYFISSTGHVGLCPWPAKKGDIIALSHGVTAPYLLRPVIKSGSAKEPLASAEHREGYELV
ncbi:heterokaryon incompatibility protein-domain-containing protein [Xylaria digitata]|nr:heterokaryon incompatibility protein-domain-containing protein [Xylaria digitata]